MQNPTDKTSRMLLKTEEELFNTVITVIDETHPFRKLNQLIDFEAIISPLRDLYSDWGQKGIDVSKGFKALYFILYLFKNFVRGFDTPASRPYAS